MNFQEANKKAENLDKTLRADDPRFQRSVIVFHDEGTTLFFVRAFLLEDDEFYYIFTEHHRFYVYAKDDITKIMEFPHSRIWTTERMP